ncbi:MAG: sulfate reduction electron transfer complex DsrMKJOP subunit DsrJ [Chloroflexi bacterium]|nr:sulfate reduction electron transfer complex DsrMKJOP subunit DsrJ [Chloroflexota bacterium]MCL5110715.1 sulfate reduction electron transfer complex DsrMKJOP subunit DsrJ [Chloroflexota bacterium]
MYDARYVLAGLALFVGVVIGVAAYAIVTNATAKAPQLVLSTNEKQCVEATDYMRTNHVQLLTQWREDVTRNGDRIYTSKLSGKQFEKSLTNTCLGCHQNKQQFCDTCHSYAGVSPNCWDCHNVPKEQHT